MRGSLLWMVNTGSRTSEVQMAPKLTDRPSKGRAGGDPAPAQTIQISEPKIGGENGEPQADLNRSWADEDKTFIDTHGVPIDISEMLDAAGPIFQSGEAIDLSRAQALTLLYQLPLQFSEQNDFDTLLQIITERLVEIIPGASRGALLLQ